MQLKFMRLLDEQFKSYLVDDSTHCGIIAVPQVFLPMLHGDPISIYNSMRQIMSDQSALNYCRHTLIAFNKMPPDWEVLAILPQDLDVTLHVTVEDGYYASNSQFFAPSVTKIEPKTSRGKVPWYEILVHSPTIPSSGPVKRFYPATLRYFFPILLPHYELDGEQKIMRESNSCYYMLPKILHAETEQTSHLLKRLVQHFRKHGLQVRVLRSKHSPGAVTLRACVDIPYHTQVDVYWRLSSIELHKIRTPALLYDVANAYIKQIYERIAVELFAN